MPARRVDYNEVEGVKFPKFFSKECFESALRLKPQRGDIFIATYPKGGTTWMQNVVLNVLRRGEPLERPRDFFLASPFLDQLGAVDSESMMIRPGAYKTHLPFEKVPWSDDAKYIYVARNPKDCCVSFYHHMTQIPGYEFSDATFDEFFEIFMEGQLEYGDYFRHFLSWHEAAGSCPNVLLATYEEMKSDLGDVVRRVANFIGAGDPGQNPDVLDRILRNCSLREMMFVNVVLNRMYEDVEGILKDPAVPKGRKYIVTYNAALPNLEGRRRKIDLVRKGEVGGWRTVFTPDQNRRMDDKIELIKHCTDVMSIWKDAL